MTQPENHNQSTPDSVPPEHDNPAQQASELFIHGILQQLFQDTPLQKERRIQRVMQGLSDSKQEPRGSWQHSALKFSRVWLASAAALALLASMIYVGVSTEKSAEATVAASIAAMRSSGDRRFEVRSKLFTDSDLGSEPMATIDTRAPGLMLMKTKGLDSKLAPGLTVGRDAEGVWAIRRDGSVDRDNPEQRWPRWSMLGDESLFADSVDQLLDTLSQAYVMKHSEASKLAGRGDFKFSHVTGTKKRAMQPGPRQIDVWIDPASNIVERIEMHFEPPPQNPSGGPDGPGGQGLGGPPPNRPDRKGPPGAARPEHRGDFPPEGRPDRPGPQDRPFGPPPAGMADGKPARELEPLGPQGRSGGPAHPGPRIRPDPLRGPRGERLPPLELLVIDRVSPPAFPEGYFEAAKYAGTTIPEVLPTR